MLKARNGEPVPSNMKIIVDGEQLRESTKTDFERMPSKIIQFLERKMFENYLLDSDAISAVLLAEFQKSVKAMEIEDFLTLKRGQQTKAKWLNECHGTNILSEIFQKFDGEFRKTTHSVALTDWLTKNKPEVLAPLRIEIAKAFETESTSSGLP
jgi:hypothetical protein